MKKLIGVLCWAGILMGLPVISYAATSSLYNSDFSQWLYNIARQVPTLEAFVVAVAYVSGIGFIIGAIVKLKTVAQNSSSMMQREGVNGPLVHILIGTVLIYFAGFVNVGTETIFGADVAYAYSAGGGGLGSFDALITPVIDIVELIGMIAFIKGLYILSKLGQQSGGQGQLSKGLIHLIGGVLAMNIEASYMILLNTLQGL